MSLELAIQQNTAAINALIEILSKGLGATIVSPDALEEQVLEEKPKAKRLKKEAAPEAPAGEPASEPSAPAPASGANAASATAAAASQVAEPVTREQVSKALTTLASKKGRDAAMKVLNAIGCKNLGEVDAASYAALLADCEAALS